MDNESQRDNCLKEVQLHQVSTPSASELLVMTHCGSVCLFLEFRSRKHRQVPELVH